MAKKTNFNVNGKEYYRVTRTVGKKADGTPIRKPFYGSCKSEAEEKADEYMNKLKNGLVTNFENITIQELMQTWLFESLHNSSDIKPSTFQRYEGIYRNYIKDSRIAGLKVHSFNLIQLQTYYNELSKKEYSYSQIKTLNTVLKVFFNWCIKNGYILRNPCIHTEIKGNKTDIMNNKVKREKVQILYDDEIQTIKEYVKGTDFELLFLLALATGLRQGELLALNWKYINFDKKYVEVKQSVKEVYVYDNEDEKHIETIFQAPKTLKSFRKVALPDSMVNVLKGCDKKEGLLFHDEEGNPLKGKNISSKWTKILKDCNIPHRKFHAIRHTYGSILMKNKVDIVTIGELMGHSATTITEIYLESTDEQKVDAVKEINYLF